MKKCKCEHDKKFHPQGIHGCFYPEEGIVNFDNCKCDCKQFAPSEDEICKHGKMYYCQECYNKEKGCGKFIYLDNYEKGEKARASPCGQDILCKSCLKLKSTNECQIDSSNHSSRVSNESEDKEPDTLRSHTDESGSTSTLSDKIGNCGSDDLENGNVFNPKDVKEFIRNYEKVLIKKYAEEKITHKNHRVQSLLVDLRQELFELVGSELSK